MKFKHSNGMDIEFDDVSAIYNLLEREGFTEVAEGDDKAQLVATAKELGIKSPHLMSIEKLRAKIAELTAEETVTENI